jgi:pyruvate,orthophosphate dikinase
LQASRGVTLDVELTAEDLMELVRRYKDVYRQLGLVLPENPRDQLREAICAVFR